jgi:hypothetical protein
MKLDIGTPRGQQTLADELDAVAIYESHYPQCRYIHTPKKEPADIDGLIVGRLDASLVCITETKCRYDTTLERFADVYNAEWLVTFTKIINGIRVGEALCVPFYGFLYIVPDRALLMRRIWSPQNGLEFARLVVRKTKTQATCNGGEAVRDNAFLEMTGVEPLFLKEGVRNEALYNHSP